jgi:hypothetical protein
MKSEISTDNGLLGSGKAVFNSSGNRERARKTSYSLLQALLWVFALVGWAVFAYQYLLHAPLQ